MKEQQNERLHLALAFDEKFLTPFYVLLTSVFHNNRTNQIVIHTIATGVDEKEREKITKFVEQNRGNIFFYTIDESHKVESLFIPDLEKSPFTKAIFYRFFFPFLVPEEVKRLLYLDVDIVVIGDLWLLYTTPLKSYPVGAVVDKAVYVFDFGPEVLGKLGIEGDDQYFNSGVLLINIEQWKRQKISEKAIQFLTEQKEKIRFPDQDALNAVLKDNWYKLDHKYNLCYVEVPLEAQKKDIVKDAVIIHYSSEHKPWKALGGNKLRYFYHYYLKKSPHAGHRKYDDFKWTSAVLKRFFLIRLLELYFEHPKVVAVIRRVRKSFN